MATVVFLHAHPDDEAIFTGGTLALLAGRGHRTVVVIATSSENHRETETKQACAVLGVDRVEFLGFSDSGLSLASAPPEGFVRADVGEAIARLGRILAEEHPAALVTYDEGGIYGHPDHLATHQVGLAAAEAHDIATVYEATVDREYLHFVETHLVGNAVLALHEAEPVGMPTVFISATVDVGAVLDAKRRAIAAHASQIPVGSAPMTMDADSFRAVYGYEWYVRRGPPGPIDDIAM